MYGKQRLNFCDAFDQDFLVLVYKYQITTTKLQANLYGHLASMPSAQGNKWTYQLGTKEP